MCMLNLLFEQLTWKEIIKSHFHCWNEGVSTTTWWIHITFISVCVDGGVRLVSDVIITVPRGTAAFKTSTVFPTLIWPSIGLNEYINNKTGSVCIM